MKYCLPMLSALVLSFFALPAGNDARKVFSDIYTYKVWGTNKEGQGWSGPGSAPEHTTNYRAFLQDFLDAFDIHSVVDLGCGDWEFSHLTIGMELIIPVSMW